MPSHRPFTLVSILAMLLGGCVAGPRPDNVTGATWQPQQQGRGPTTDIVTCAVAAPLGALPAPGRVAAEQWLYGVATLSPGDRIRVRVLGDEQRITGLYVIQPDGSLLLPGSAPIATAGLDAPGLGVAVRHTLSGSGQIRALDNAVDVRLVESVGASVSVAGAVFEPGAVRAGERSSEDRLGQRDGTASGDANPARSLSAALRAAGGVRPDADLGHVRIVRGDRWAEIDVSGALEGARDVDVQMASGDRVIVPSTGCFDARLVRPSPLTTPGIRVYMSNLSRPANNNAGAAIGKESSSLPYGTRLLQGLVGMNCVGGSAMNAGRRAVLISRNPLNGRSVVVERAVERLVRDAGRDEADPYLMPGDAIACYDSRWMNVQDAVALVGSAASIATPAILLRTALK